VVTRRMNGFVVVLVALVVALALMPYQSVWAAETHAESSTALRDATLDSTLRVRDPASVVPVLVRSSRELHPASPLVAAIGDVSPASTIWVSTHTWEKTYHNVFGWTLARHSATTQWFWSNGTIVAPGSLWGSYTTWLGWSWENAQRWWNFVALNRAQAIDQVTFVLQVAGVTIQSFTSTITTNVDGWGNSWAY